VSASFVMASRGKIGSRDGVTQLITWRRRLRRLSEGADLAETADETDVQQAAFTNLGVTRTDGSLPQPQMLLSITSTHFEPVRSSPGLCLGASSFATSPSLMTYPIPPDWLFRPEIWMFLSQGNCAPTSYV
jgi:hypothetical protein